MAGKILAVNVHGMVASWTCRDCKHENEANLIILMDSIVGCARCERRYKIKVRDYFSRLKLPK